MSWYIKFSLAGSPTEHKQKELNEHTDSFLLSVPPDLAIKLNFNVWKVAYNSKYVMHAEYVRNDKTS